ncbi:MAG TPA: phosphate ABC transporter permease subunit PstC [bacterium]|nr:phosphate ABC transporter permease subunit PstC [bacterium]
MRKNFIERMLGPIASMSLVFLLGIALTLIITGMPAFREVGVLKFIFGNEWRPTFDPPYFGIWPLIVASFIVTFGAILFAVPIGVASAIYTAEIASPGVRETIKPVMELLASIPSVVFGFFGIVFISPILQKVLGLPTGLNGLNAAIILGLMAVPTVASITEDAISAVSKDLRNASYALGANKWETIVKTVVPAAKSGIFTAVILGVSRAMGETMTVLMAAGGARGVPSSIFVPMRPMTATIAGEMGEAVIGSTHYHALFAIGFVLFAINVIFNLAAEYVKKGGNK